MGNLTVRIDDDLKRDAERAALLTDVTVSQVVRKALRSLVQFAKTQEGWECPNTPTPTALRVTGGRAARYVQDNATSAAREKRLGRIQVLEEKERRNELNKATREELRLLRLQETSR